MSPPKICIVGDNCIDLYPVQTKEFVGGNRAILLSQSKGMESIVDI